MIMLTKGLYQIYEFGSFECRFHISRLMFCVCLILVLTSGAIADRVPYDYNELNPAVVISQYNGGGKSVDTSFTGDRTWSVTWPKQLVLVTSGVYQQYSTYAINQHSDARYGQIMVTLGKDSGNYVRLGLFGQVNPQFVSLLGNSGAGADVVWDPYNEIQYRSNNNLFLGRMWASSSQYHSVTVNYDLELDTYEIWLNSTKVVGPIAFDSPLTTAESIGLGGAYWSGGIAVLEYWHWLVSENTPFTLAGTTRASPECFDIWAGGGGLAADLDQDCHVTMVDFSIFATEWLRCNDPWDPDCE